MNKIQSAKMNMYRVVQSILIENANIIAEIPAMVNASNEFTAIIEAIQLQSQVQLTPIKGHTGQKAYQRFLLTEDALVVSGALYAYAVNSSNEVLKAQTKFTKSKFNRLKGNSVLSQCSNMYDKALEHLPALADYGISQKKTDEFLQLIEHYKAVFTLPRNATSNRKTATIMLAELFEKGDDILRKKIDKLALSFKKRHPGFYELLSKSRMIVDSPHRPTQIKGKITAADSGKPLRLVQVRIIDSEWQSVTNQRGNFALKTIPIGIHHLIIQKEGYAAQEIKDLEVKLGKALVVNVVLQPL
jgi:Carboxypeptidase regulatory-like domain